MANLTRRFVGSGHSVSAVLTDRSIGIRIAQCFGYILGYEPGIVIDQDSADLIAIECVDDSWQGVGRVVSGDFGGDLHSVDVPFCSAVRVPSIHATSSHLQGKHGRLGRLDKTGWV